MTKHQLTREQALKMAADAVDEMSNHPEIWATHGYPSYPKLFLITGIIADTILKAVNAEAV